MEASHAIFAQDKIWIYAILSLFSYWNWLPVTIFQHLPKILKILLCVLTVKLTVNENKPRAPWPFFLLFLCLGSSKGLSLFLFNGKLKLGFSNKCICYNSWTNATCTIFSIFYQLWNYFKILNSLLNMEFFIMPMVFRTTGFLLIDYFFHKPKYTKKMSFCFLHSVDISHFFLWHVSAYQTREHNSMFQSCCCYTWVMKKAGDYISNTDNMGTWHQKVKDN
jgi:hypothetical protein